MEHWTTDFYTRLDGGDPSWLDLCADTVRIQAGNAAVSIGRDAVMAGPLGQISSLVKSIRHTMIDCVDASDSKALLEATVTYTRHDGHTVSLPALSILERDDAGLITELRIFADVSPLFSGVASN